MFKGLHYKKIVYDILIDVVSGIFMGLGLYNFAAKAGFPMAGVSGIALILYRLFHIPIGMAVILMNIPLAIYFGRMLGKRFFLNSVRSLVITSFMIDYVAVLFPVYEGDRMLAAICTGLFSGLGNALIFMNGSSTGGMDFVTMAIHAKRPDLSIGKIVFVLDFIVVFLGGLLFRDVDALIYGLIIIYFLTAVMDKIMYGMDEGKMALIVTRRGLSIAGVIDCYIGRGSTLLRGKGSYTGQELDVVLCACSNKQMYRIRQIIKKTDPSAFLVILEAGEVVGEGFKKE